MTLAATRHVLFRATASLILGFSLLAAGAAARAQDYGAVVAAPDRAEADRQTDKRRDPVSLLGFAGPKTGWAVLDMGAGAGYSTELMARAVGPAGKVHAQIGAESEKLRARAATPAMANVTVLVRPFDDPVPAETRGLDLITFFFAYHDTTFQEVDRAKMNKALFAALKPGGHLIVADHSAQAGAGINVAKSLHRIEESVLKQEIEAAGFRLVGESNFLRNPEDPRTERVFQPKIPVDEFVLRFVKP